MIFSLSSSSCVLRLGESISGGTPISTKRPHKMKALSYSEAFCALFSCVEPRNRHNSDGRTILELPPKEINTQFVSLTNEERQVYNSLFHGGKSQFDQIVQGGTLNYEYAHVFELLMRLRQVCNHPGLVFSKNDLRDGANLEGAIMKFLDKRSQSSLAPARTMHGHQANRNARSEEHKSQGRGNNAATSTSQEGGGLANMSPEFVQETIKSFQNKELPPCTVCLEEIIDPIITNCCHVFCRGCITHIVQTLKNCPICRKPLAEGDIMQVAL